MCEALLLTVKQCAARLAIGRSVLYRYLQNGALPSLKVGGSRRIIASDLESFIQKLREESGDGYQ